MGEDAEERGQMTSLLHGGSGVVQGDPTASSTPVAPPIYQSATYSFTDPADIAGAMVAQAHPQFYGRYASPNTKHVEAMVAGLEGAEAALAVASGMAAVSLVLLTFLRSGDHLVAQTALYPTTNKLITQKLPTLGISYTLVDQTDPAAFAAAVKPETRLIYVESPANPTLALTDLTAAAALARQRGILTVADNTFASPFNQRPLELGVDLVLHSATKYLGGHSDIVAGVVVGREALITRLWQQHTMLGAVLHPMEAWLLQRGLQTFPLRMALHNQNALAVAGFLERHPAVREVYYPGLASQPQYELACRQMPGGFGGMVCFDLRGGRDTGLALLKRLRLIHLAVSLGGTHSLITHPASTVSVVQSEEAISASGVQPGLVRLSVGLEDAADLIADLRQALD
jgi:methionine-gamma-lyase